MSQIILNLFSELRKELLEAQKIRAQILGFKFTFITAAMGLILANYEKLDKNIFILPALAAIFFDFIINSYAFSIKRIGCYIRDYIEPVLSKEEGVPKDFIMWQKFLTQPKTRQYLCMYGNIGVTLLSAFVGIAGLLIDYKPISSPALIAVLLGFVVMDVLSHREPKKLGKIWADSDFTQPRDNKSDLTRQ